MAIKHFATAVTSVADAVAVTGRHRQSPSLRLRTADSGARPTFAYRMSAVLPEVVGAVVPDNVDRDPAGEITALFRLFGSLRTRMVGPCSRLAGGELTGPQHLLNG
ncbi:hypothetical protein [Streptomyces sp. NPDC000880]